MLGIGGHREHRLPEGGREQVIRHMKWIGLLMLAGLALVACASTDEDAPAAATSSKEAQVTETQAGIDENEIQQTPAPLSFCEGLEVKLGEYRAARERYSGRFCTQVGLGIEVCPSFSINQNLKVLSMMEHVQRNYGNRLHANMPDLEDRQCARTAVSEVLGNYTANRFDNTLRAVYKYYLQKRCVVQNYFPEIQPISSLPWQEDCYFPGPGDVHEFLERVFFYLIEVSLDFFSQEEIKPWYILYDKHHGMTKKFDEHYSYIYECLNRPINDDCVYLFMRHVGKLCATALVLDTYGNIGDRARLIDEVMADERVWERQVFLNKRYARDGEEEEESFDHSTTI